MIEKLIKVSDYLVEQGLAEESCDIDKLIVLAAAKKPDFSYRMPTCGKKDQDKLQKQINKLSPKVKEKTDALIEEIGLQDLCRLLHALRRWYSFNTWSVAKHIVNHRKALGKIMDFKLPVGNLWRGFRLPRNEELAQTIEEGQIIDLPVSRNGECSSWTVSRKAANLFSGASKDKLGIVVCLHSTKNAKAFIAPPAYTESWFEDLYKGTMGAAFRYKEGEYAIQGTPLKVKVVAVKK